MAADIIILTGSPGSGKSTVAARLARSFENGVHLPTDDYWRYIVAGGIAPFLPESHDQNETVMSAIAATARQYAHGGFTVVVDGIVGPWMLPHFKWLPLEHIGARLHYIVLRPSRDEALSRAQARDGEQDLKDEEPVVSLWQQFAVLDGYESHVLDNTCQSIEQMMRAVQDIIRNGTHTL